jgi:hypothetical protein
VVPSKTTVSPRCQLTNLTNRIRAVTECSRNCEKDTDPEALSPQTQRFTLTRVVITTMIVFVSVMLGLARRQLQEVAFV